MICEARRAGALLLLILQGLLLGCAPGPAEEAVTSAIRDMAEAVESRSAGPVVDRLHEHFVLERGPGKTDRRETRRLLSGVLLRHREISVRLMNVRVEPRGRDEQRATARFNALVTGGSGGILPETGQLYRVESEWAVADGDWKVLRARARQATEP